MTTLCPGLTGVPTWNTQIEDIAKVFPVDPAVATPDCAEEVLP